MITFSELFEPIVLRARVCVCVHINLLSILLSLLLMRSYCSLMFDFFSPVFCVILYLSSSLFFCFAVVSFFPLIPIFVRWNTFAFSSHLILPPTPRFWPWFPIYLLFLNIYPNFEYRCSAATVVAWLSFSNKKESNNNNHNQHNSLSVREQANDIQLTYVMWVNFNVCLRTQEDQGMERERNTRLSACIWSKWNVCVFVYVRAMHC